MEIIQKRRKKKKRREGERKGVVREGAEEDVRSMKTRQRSRQNTGRKGRRRKRKKRLGSGERKLNVEKEKTQGINEKKTWQIFFYR